MRKSYRQRRDAHFPFRRARFRSDVRFADRFPESSTFRVFAADVCAALADAESVVDRAVAERLNAQFRQPFSV